MSRVAVFLCLWSVAVYGSCFDFSKPVKKLMRPAIALGKGKPTTDWGNIQGGFIWSAAREVVATPIEKVLKLCLDPMMTRNKENTELKVEKKTTTHFFEIHTIQIEVDVTFFFSLEWEEVWGYELLKGTRKKPQKVLISYAKTNGTSYLEKKCGHILLNKVSPTKTDVFLFEEIKASRWDEVKAIASHIGTMKNLKPN